MGRTKLLYIGRKAGVLPQKKTPLKVKLAHKHEKVGARTAKQGKFTLESGNDGQFRQ